MPDLQTMVRRCRTVAYLACHPGQLRYVPRWVRQRSLTPLELRVPWWPYEAAAWVLENLPAGSMVFEYGGGGSTMWLEDHGATVTVVEHDPEWYGQLTRDVSAQTELVMKRAQPAGEIGSDVSAGFFDGYVAAIDGQPEGGLDLVIVDGRARVACVRAAMGKVKTGGLLLLDDSDRDRYAPAVRMLASWDRHVFSGIKPGSPVPVQTSVWRRPA
jgi:hypothetical protein